MRRMTSNLHVSDECKQELDSLIPKDIDKEKITYDTGILAMIFFLKDTLGFGEHDIVEMIISYRKHKLEEHEMKVIA